MARGIDITRLFGRTPALSQTGVITKWKGLLVFRKRPGDITGMTPAQEAIRDKLSELSAQWMSELTDEQRSQWDAYAKSKENLNQWDYIMSATAGVIPKKKNIMSGFNAFISSNALAVSAGIADLRKKAPTSEKIMPPIITNITGTTDITVNWTNPTFTNKPDVVRVRLWAEVTGKAHKQVIKYRRLGFQTWTFSTMKSKLGDVKTIAELSPGVLKVQMDTITANNLEGAEHSYFSNIEQITI